MGTNYYARTVPCAHCGRSDGDIHICKNLTSFRGHFDDRCGYGSAPSPWGEIRSWADWRRVLREHSVQVFDEYGGEHEVEQFIRDVEATPLSARRRQYDWMVAHYPEDPREWLDADGFSFSSAEFS